MTVTAQQFRADGDKRMALFDVIHSNPILLEALACITEVPTEAPPLGTSPTDLARMLGEIQERLRIVPKLLELSTPLPQPQPQPRETFGTSHTVDEFDQAETP